MYLCEGLQNHIYRIEKIETDVYTRNILSKWEIKKGSLICIIRKHSFYPYIVSIYHSYIALDHHIVRKIKVIPYD